MKVRIEFWKHIIEIVLKSIKLNAQSQIAIVKTNSGSGLAIEGDLNYKSNNVKLDGTFKEPFPDFDDDEPKEGQKPEPPKEEKKSFNWLGVGLAVLSAAVAIAVAVALAPVTVTAAICACAVVGAAVSFTADVVTQVEQNGGITSKEAWSKVAWDQSIIAACGGAASGAFAAAPIGLGGEILINGAIGGTQAALNGGSAKDIALGVGTGLLVGKLGGPGYQSTAHFWKALYTREALQTVRGGIIWGVGVSGFTTAAGYAIEKANRKR